MTLTHRLRRLGYPTYRAYLRSPHWRRFRLEYKRERGWECVCGERARLELHHLTYERLGAERLEDVRALCQTCHSTLHQLHREGQATLDPASLFSPLRAAEYAERKPARPEPEPAPTLTRSPVLPEPEPEPEEYDPPPVKPPPPSQPGQYPGVTLSLVDVELGLRLGLGNLNSGADECRGFVYGCRCKGCLRREEGPVEPVRQPWENVDAA